MFARLLFVVYLCMTVSQGALRSTKINPMTTVIPKQPSQYNVVQKKTYMDDMYDIDYVPVSNPLNTLLY